MDTFPVITTGGATMTGASGSSLGEGRGGNGGGGPSGGGPGGGGPGGGGANGGGGGLAAEKVCRKGIPNRQKKIRNSINFLMVSSVIEMTSFPNSSPQKWKWSAASNVRQSGLPFPKQALLLLIGKITHPSFFLNHFLSHPMLIDSLPISNNTRLTKVFSI